MFPYHLKLEIYITIQTIFPVQRQTKNFFPHISKFSKILKKKVTKMLKIKKVIENFSQLILRQRRSVFSVSFDYEVFVLRRIEIEF